MPEQLAQPSDNHDGSEIDPNPFSLAAPTDRERRTLRLIGIHGLTVETGEGAAAEEDGHGVIYVGPIQREVILKEPQQEERIESYG